MDSGILIHAAVMRLRRSRPTRGMQMSHVNVRAAIGHLHVTTETWKRGKRYLMSPRYCYCTPQGSRTLDNYRLRLVGSGNTVAKPTSGNQSMLVIHMGLTLPVSHRPQDGFGSRTHTWSMMRVVVRVHRNLSITVSHLAARGKQLVPMGTVKSPPDVDTKLPFSADTERAADWWATH